MESPATCATCGAENPPVDDEGMHVGPNHPAMAKEEGGDTGGDEGEKGGDESASPAMEESSSTEGGEDTSGGTEGGAA